jgi:Fe2+ transport system protein FeoA
MATADELLSLIAAQPGHRYVVAAVHGGDALAERLQASGMWAGAPVELLAQAPFGGPLLFRVHGYRLALRRAEARRVEVTEAVA